MDPKAGARCVPCAPPRAHRPGVLTRSLADWPGRVYTSKELAQHTSPDDCWLVIKGKVYDVSGWGQEHPGGGVVYTYGGKVSGCGWFSPFAASPRRAHSPDASALPAPRPRRTPPTSSPHSTRPQRGSRCAGA